MKVLVVDDDPGMLEFLGLMLKKRGHEVVTTTDAIKALEMVRSGEKFDVVIADIRMKPVDGLAVLREVKKHSPETSVVMISAYANEETALQAMNEGAYDYLPKPFQLDELYRILDELAGLKDSEEGEIQCGRYHLHFGLFIGESPAMHRVYDAIRKVALVDSTVLISGESGTGKELVAKAIHRLSRRSKGPFVVVNCGGVPESLIESELFGYKKGAFTGATSDRKGLVEAAHGGTLFLDEIGELTPALQVKLLRLIQEKSIRRIGDTCDIPVDVRIIAATNRDLEQMVLEGSFREDLYYRLNVIPIRLPPLRERREDIPLLAHYFMEKYSSLLGKDVRRISSYALDILRRYDFPGNVRELENIIERGVALEQSRIILPESLTIASGLMMRKKRVESPAPLFGEIPPEGLNLDELLEKVERHYLIEALKQTQGHKQRAAELLGMTFRSFRYRLAKHRIEVPEEDTRETGR